MWRTFSDRSKGGALSKGVTSEGAILLDETFHVHIIECCLPGDDKSDLSKLSSEEKTVGMAEGAFGGTNINLGEERGGLDMVMVSYIMSMYLWRIAWPLIPPKCSLGLSLMISTTGKP